MNGYLLTVVDHDDFSTDGARAAAAEGALADWVAAFLSSPGSDNAPLAAKLTETPRWWLAPVRVPLDDLARLAGPPGAPVLEVVDEDDWRDDVDDLADKVRDGFEPAPVIASYEDGQLTLEDGNHRVEALRRAGVEQTWAVIGFDAPEDRDRFTADLDARDLA